MNCVKVKRLISQYIDNELANQNLKTSVDEHIAHCASCQKEFKLLKLQKNLIAGKERLTVGDEFLARLEQKLPLDEAIAIRIKWLPEAGELARKLIPVPAVITLLLFSLVFRSFNGVNPVDEYIFSDLNNEEIGIVYGYLDNTDLLVNGMF